MSRSPMLLRADHMEPYVYRKTGTISFRKTIILSSNKGKDLPSLVHSDKRDVACSESTCTCRTDGAYELPRRNSRPRQGLRGSEFIMELTVKFLEPRLVTLHLSVLAKVAWAIE